MSGSNGGRRRNGRTPRRSTVRGWLVAMLLAGTILCIGGAVFVANSGRLVESLRPTALPVATSATGILRPGAVRPVYVLNWLAGSDATAVIETALDRNEAPTAYALTLFAEEVDTSRRILLLHQTADRLREDAPGDAASLYALVGQVALVSPHVDDLTRAHLLLETGDALLALRHRELALRNWQQVSILARYGPALAPQRRVQLLEAIAVRYDAAGEPARAAAAQERMAEALQMQSSRVVPVDVPDVRPVDWPPDVFSVIGARQSRAQAARNELDNGRSPDWTALEEALLAEEEAVQNWLATPIDDPLRRQERYRWWIQQRRLLALGVFEPGAVPRMEARRATFDQIVSQLWEQREPEIETMIVDLPAEESVAVQRAWLEHRLFIYLIGGDPHVDVSTLWQALEQINSQAPDDNRLRLVHQADELLETRYWRLPIGYFRGELDATDVFR